MIKFSYFVIEVIIEHTFIGFSQNMVVFIEKSKYFPHYVLIEHRAVVPNGPMG